MTTTCGPLADFKPVRCDFTRTVISFLPTEQPNGMFHWHEVYYNKRSRPKPSIEEVKRKIIDDINAETDDKILRTFVWRDIPVWLSMENQNNIKGAYMIARDAPERLPIVMKFGTDDMPIMHTFTSVDDLADLNLAMFDHISKCCAEGWQKKYSINWAEIEQALNTK